MSSCEKELISMYKINNLGRYINNTVHKPSEVQENKEEEKKGEIHNERLRGPSKKKRINGSDVMNDDDDDDTSGMRHACVSKKVNMVLNVHRNHEAY